MSKSSKMEYTMIKMLFKKPDDLFIFFFLYLLDLGILVKLLDLHILVILTL